MSKPPIQLHVEDDTRQTIAVSFARPGRVTVNVTKHGRIIVHVYDGATRPHCDVCDGVGRVDEADEDGRNLRPLCDECDGTGIDEDADEPIGCYDGTETNRGWTA